MTLAAPCHYVVINTTGKTGDTLLNTFEKFIMEKLTNRCKNPTTGLMKVPSRTVMFWGGIQHYDTGF